MKESFINLVEKFNSQSLKDYRDQIRTNIYKEINELRKKDDKFSKRLEIEERDFLSNLLREHNNSNLKKFFNLYECLKNLKYHIDFFKDLVNTD